MRSRVRLQSNLAATTKMPQCFGAGLITMRALYSYPLHRVWCNVETAWVHSFSLLEFRHEIAHSRLMQGASRKRRNSSTIGVFGCLGLNWHFTKRLKGICIGQCLVSSFPVHVSKYSPSNIRLYDHPESSIACNRSKVFYQQNPSPWLFTSEIRRVL